MAEHFSLDGHHVHLLPMGRRHVDGLLAAATSDRTTFAFTPMPDDRAGMAAYVDKALAKRAPATTSPSSPGAWPTGASWAPPASTTWPPGTGSSHSPGTDAPASARPARRGLHRVHLARALGPAEPGQHRGQAADDATRLREWEVRVVRIQTDARNIRSRRAIERLGCALDGVIRAERPAADGGVRDSGRLLHAGPGVAGPPATPDRPARAVGPPVGPGGGPTGPPSGTVVMGPGPRGDGPRALGRAWTGAVSGRMGRQSPLKRPRPIGRYPTPRR